MREIKFRGRDEHGKWHYGDLLSWPIIRSFNGLNYEHKEVAADTVGQFTGLRDADGREIYEGDIVAGYWDFEEDEWPAVVEWDEVSARFVLSGQNSVIPLNEMGGLEVTIIGNVYDNPELLEAQA